MNVKNYLIFLNTNLKIANRTTYNKSTIASVIERSWIEPSAKITGPIP